MPLEIKKYKSKKKRNIYYKSDCEKKPNQETNSLFKNLFVEPRFKIHKNFNSLPEIQSNESDPIANINEKGLQPNAITTANPPYSPQIIRQVYNINQIVPTGKVPKVAIVDCYYNPNVQSDMDVWTNYYGLPQKTINLINLGTNTNIATGSNTGWYLEAMLDIQYVYTACPTCDIWLIMAKSASYIDIKEAISKANSIGANVVSMSFGAPEPPASFFNSSSSLESVFTSTSCSYLASTGDNAFASYPALSPKVMGVGGTTLNVNYDTVSKIYSRKNEQTWGDPSTANPSASGAGYSKYFSKPTYQSGIPIIRLNKRGIADISSVANPSTGVVVYCSNYQPGSSGWYQVGGTSLSCPLMAGLVANALIDRFNNSKSSLTTVNNSSNSILTSIYSQYKTNLSNFKTLVFDPTTGQIDNGFKPGIGFDFPTGLGVPNYTQFALFLKSI